jgi:hypothetical protein
MKRACGRKKEAVVSKPPNTRLAEETESLELLADKGPDFRGRPEKASHKRNDRSVGESII